MQNVILSSKAKKLSSIVQYLYAVLKSVSKDWKLLIGTMVVKNVPIQTNGKENNS